MSDVFVGIVEGSHPNAVTVGVVQGGGRISGASFAIEPTNLREYYVTEPDGRHRYDASRPLRVRALYQ